MLGSPCANAASVTLSGQITAEFKGKSFSHFAISAVNAPEEFRHQYERRMHDYLRKHFRGNSKIIEVNRYINDNGRLGQQADRFNLLNNLKQNRIEVLILFNVHNQGGENLEKSMPLAQAADLSQHFQHNLDKVSNYDYVDVTLYELATGKVIWQGSGPIRATPTATAWFKKSAKIQTVRLYKLLKKARVLASDSRDRTFDDMGD